MGVDDVTVDLGEIPIEHARTLLLCVENCLGYGHFWAKENNERAFSLKSMLSYRIAKAEKTATWAEPA